MPPTPSAPRELVHEPGAPAHLQGMKRTQFEESLIRNANDAHAATRAAGIPALIGVPAYLTGRLIGTTLLTAEVLISGRWPR